MMGQKGLKHAGVSGFYNIIVNLMQLCLFLGLNHSNCIVMHGMENGKFPALIWVGREGWGGDVSEDNHKRSFNIDSSCHHTCNIPRTH